MLCPRCEKAELVKKELENGKYILTCPECGLERGILPPDNKKGVV